MYSAPSISLHVTVWAVTLQPGNASHVRSRTTHCFSPCPQHDLVPWPHDKTSSVHQKGLRSESWQRIAPLSAGLEQGVFVRCGDACGTERAQSVCIQHTHGTLPLWERRYIIFLKQWAFQCSLVVNKKCWSMQKAAGSSCTAWIAFGLGGTRHVTLCSACAERAEPFADSLCQRPSSWITS